MKKLFAGVTLCALSLCGSVSAGWAEDLVSPVPASETALIRPDVEQLPSIELPRVLSDADVARYKKIIDLQERGMWPAADREIKKLENDILIGTLLAQRYLHPDKYNSRFKELYQWLSLYNDSADAGQIYKLAMRKRGRTGRYPPTPAAGYLSGSGHDGEYSKTPSYNPTKDLSKQDRAKAAAYKRKMRWYVRKGATKSVKELLQTVEVRRLLHQVEFDEIQAMLAAGYYADGRDDWALGWAQKAVKRSGEYLPEAYWTGALAAWRMGKLDLAIEYFSKAAESKYASPWVKSAAAYWAARSNLKARKPQEVNGWLGIAASYPRTFYGFLARRALGFKANFDWTPPEFDEDSLKRLLDSKNGRRAVALVQLGLDVKAEHELRALYGKVKNDPDILKAMLALATRSNMPSLAMRLGGVLSSKGLGAYDIAAYPTPEWSPEEGFSVDRALVYAIMRQESGFNPVAKSHAGARGLMQLMPATASFVAKDRSLSRSNREDLLEPDLNIEIGQRYVTMLLADAGVGGDLFRLAAAWNGGPGNLQKWQRTVKHNDDPLLFIESLPSRETRNFIERVLTNLWIYRDRLGQESPSLVALAEGKWPTYSPQDQRSVQLAEGR